MVFEVVFSYLIFGLWILGYVYDNFLIIIVALSNIIAANKIKNIYIELRVENYFGIVLKTTRQISVNNNKIVQVLVFRLLNERALIISHHYLYQRTSWKCFACQMDRNDQSTSRIWLFAAELHNLRAALRLRMYCDNWKA